MIDPKKSALIVSEYRKNPIKFFIDALDVKQELIWPKMVEIAESVRDNKKTAVKAGHSVSKSFTSSRIALWFLYNFYPSTVITTAPSHVQVEDILWREIRSAHAQARIPLGGKVTKTQIDLAEKWFAYGFATKPDTVTQQATRFQGFHNDNVLVIFDEAAGIDKLIWQSKDALLTAGHCRFLAIGNPTVSKGDFADCFKDKAFNKITISVKDTPNYKLGREVIPGVSGREYEEDTRIKYGVDSNYYKARVLGEIPDDDADNLIPVSWIEKAEKRDPYPYKFTKRFLTVDVADGGDDWTVIKAWDNKTEVDELVLRGMKVEECEPHVWRMLRKNEGNAIIVDGDGIGRVMIGLLKSAKDAETEIIEFVGSSVDVRNPKLFQHRRSEGHWAMRQDFKDNIISISRSAEQREELSSIKLDDKESRGFIKVEPKKYIKERIGRSPNLSDAVMMMSAEFDRVPFIKKAEDKYRRNRTEEYAFNPNTV